MYTAMPGEYGKRRVIGCVPKQNPLPPAPTDLRDMPLPQDWVNTAIFRLGDGLVEYIPDLPPNLRTLEISKNRLREIPTLPQTLQTIDLNNNRLQEIPALPPNLDRLEIHNNFLETLPAPLPKSLQKLSAKRNLLTTLPSFAETKVESVGISFNRLISLPTFPETLRKLGCSHNNITVIENLPSKLMFLNCSNNPLEVLRIENLRLLEMLIATNCKLREIPILAENEWDMMRRDNNDNNDNNDDNNNNQGGGGVQKGGSYRRFIFDNNPLTPNFQAIYDRYRSDYISETTFRKEVLAEHKRMLAERKATLGSMIQTFKPAVISTKELTAEERVRERLSGNHGPLNLIASFITGKPGTIEAQRLAMIENQEKIGAVPKGTAQAARQKIADIAALGSETRKEGVPNLMQARAKLYVTRQNIEEAKVRAKVRYEQMLARIAAREKLKVEEADLIRRLGKVVGDLIEKHKTASDAVDKFVLDRIKNKYFMKRQVEVAKEIDDFITKTLTSGDEANMIFGSIVRQTYKNKDLREYVNLKLKEKLWNEGINNIRSVQNRLKRSLVERFNKSFRKLQNPEQFILDMEASIRAVVDRLFPKSRSDENLEKAGKTLYEEIMIFNNLWYIIGIDTGEFDDYVAFDNEEENNNTISVISENTNNNNENGNNENGDEVKEAANDLAVAQDEFIGVIDDDGEEGEAMRIAMAEAQREFENEEEELNFGDEDEEELNFADEENENEEALPKPQAVQLLGPGWRPPVGEEAIRAEIERVQRDLNEARRERNRLQGVVNAGENEENVPEENVDAAINEWNHRQQQDGGKKKRHHSTPRKHKSKRQTRRH